MLLEGGIPYVDFFDPLPPMGFYVHVVPVIFAKILGADRTTIFNVSVAALALYSACGLLLALPRLRPWNSWVAHILTVAAWTGFSVYIASLGWFGEREHLFILAYVPFLCCRLERHLNLPVGIVAALVSGFIAAPFMLLKPFFCFTAACVEAWLLIRSRRFSCLLAAETIVIAVWTVLYILHFFVAPAAMQHALIHEWLPHVIAYADLWNQPLTTFAFRSLPFLPYYMPFTIVFTLGALFLSLRMFWNLRIQVEALAWGLLVSYAMLLLQHKGWLYQTFPMLGFSILLTMTVVLAVLDPESAFEKPRWRISPRFRSAAFCAICLTLIGGSAAISAHRFVTRDTVRAASDQFVNFILEQTDPGDKVVWLSIGGDVACQSLIYTDRRQGARYPTAWPIAIFYRHSRPPKEGRFQFTHIDQTSGQERRYLEDMGTDIRKNRPKLIFIQSVQAPGLLPEGLIIEDYLEQTGWKERYMTEYMFLAKINGHSAYRRIK